MGILIALVGVIATLTLCIILMMIALVIISK